MNGQACGRRLLSVIIKRGIMDNLMKGPPFNDYHLRGNLKELILQSPI